MGTFLCSSISLTSQLPAVTIASFPPKKELLIAAFLLLRSVRKASGFPSSSNILRVSSAFCHAGSLMLHLPSSVYHWPFCLQWLPTHLHKYGYRFRRFPDLFPIQPFYVLFRYIRLMSSHPLILNSGLVKHVFVVINNALCCTEWDSSNIYRHTVP